MLYGAAADDVSGNKALQYQLEARAGEKNKQNNNKGRHKASKLRDKDGLSSNHDEGHRVVSTTAAPRAKQR